MPDTEGDLFSDPPASVEPPPRRASNSIEFSPERTRADARKKDAEEPQIGEAGGPSHRPGDVPASFTRRYLTETLEGGRSVLYFAGAGAKRPAFRDDGRKLSTDQSTPAVLRDLAGIAAHRGWTCVRVRGSDEFRREAWLEARALGLEVKGFAPKERDQQVLDRRQSSATRAARRAGESARTATKGPPRSQSSTRERPDRPDYAAGVTGALLASGVAPYRRRKGEPQTPFIRLDRGEGKALDIWGVGLPDALARSGAQVGDAVRVRREGMDVLQRAIDVSDPKTGAKTTQIRDVSRNRWVIEADRFRSASPGASARDPDLKSAQSHLAVLNTVIDKAVHDPKLRAQLRVEARDIVADELAQGRRFPPARVREIEPVLARDAGLAHAREAAAERVHRR